MSVVIVPDGPRRADRLVATVNTGLLLAGFALVPGYLYLIALLFFFQDPILKFDGHPLREMAIAATTLKALFVTYATWRCDRSSGEPLLRWDNARFSLLLATMVNPIR